MSGEITGSVGHVDADSKYVAGNSADLWIHLIQRGKTNTDAFDPNI